MLKALILTISLITLTSNAYAIEANIFDEVTAHAQNVIHGESYKFASEQKQLLNQVAEFSTVAIANPEFEQEVTELQESLIETEKLNALRIALTKELKSEPTAEELMTSYFELKASESLK